MGTNSVTHYLTTFGICVFPYMLPQVDLQHMKLLCAVFKGKETSNLIPSIKTVPIPEILHSLFLLLEKQGKIILPSPGQDRIANVQGIAVTYCLKRFLTFRTTDF
ncbi:Protein Dopey-1 [Manis pentadactyla]|nr:Protein Dopey-1 [Manis pentadactyla]